MRIGFHFSIWSNSLTRINIVIRPVNVLIVGYRRKKLSPYLYIPLKVVSYVSFIFIVVASRCSAAFVYNSPPLEIYFGTRSLCLSNFHVLRTPNILDFLQTLFAKLPTTPTHVCYQNCLTQSVLISRFRTYPPYHNSLFHS